MSGQYLLVSIHPRHAEQIFQGYKSVELRKMRPRVDRGDTVLVYVSAPKKSLVGSFVVRGVVEGEPHCLWEEFGAQVGLTKKEFNDYFGRAKRGVGIVLEDARRFCESIPLNTLRKRIRGFHPPRTYRYISPTELDNIGISAI